MKYDAILYDLDGTILDTVGDLCDSINHALEKFSFPPVSPEQTAQYLGNGAKQFVALACPKGTDGETMEKVLSVYKPWYDAHCRIKTAPYEGIVTMMQRFKAMGVKQAVVSNKPDLAVQLLAKEYFPELLELAVGESSGVRRKPAPDSVLAAAEQIAVPIEKCVYIGDTEVDILTAENAGMDCISVTWGFRNSEQLRNSGAKILVDSTDELFDAIVKD